MIKKSKIHWLLMTICLIISLNNCIYYRTVTVPVNQIILKEYLSTKPIWTVEDANHKINGISNVEIQNDSLYGKLFYYGFPDHPDNRITYMKKRGVYSKEYFHLLINSNESSNDFKIPISDIISAKTHENAPEVSILVSTGATVAVIATVAAAATAVVAIAFVTLLGGCNCPYVTVIGADTAQFQGSMFPGAISKSLERRDNLIMRDVPLDKNGQISVQISNELPEKEYLDQVELCEANNIRHTSLGLNSMGQPVSFNLKDQLLSAITGYGRDITKEVQTYLDGSYDFCEMGNDYELNRMYLIFKRDDLKDHLKLIVHARQSKWLENVAEFYFQQLGTKFPEWEDQQDKVDPRVYSRISTERGISLNAYIKHNSHWAYIGSYENAGTLSFRNLTMDLDISKIRGETIEIKLETAHGFWDIDYAGLTDEWGENINLTRLKTISAITQDGKDVLPQISRDDQVYVEQPSEGTFTYMVFEAPENPDSYLILLGKGYYHHIRNYTEQPNYQVLKEMEKIKLSAHQVSRIIQSQVTAEVHINENH